MTGTRLGSYEVLAPLGAGGMGAVYRARDTKLGRDVAIKVLPPEFVGDAERVARFQREAQVLAALNHPHIAQIYGFEEAADADGPPKGGHYDNVGPGFSRASFLVMELVDGETLDQRIARGPIPVDEALPIAKQIAEALEAAHEKGIIHRDLKPSNIAVTKDGAVKVLDFGLAKLASPAEAGRYNASMSPTITSPALMTGVGVLLGTAAYMSPEQAKGREADKRSDVWAFGCVLYEMLTGTRAFDGDDVVETLAAVVRGEPDWSRATTLHPALASVLKRCLAKSRSDRLASPLTALLLLPEWSAPTTAERTRRWLVAASAGALLAIGAVATAIAVRSSPSAAPSPVIRFTLEPPSGTSFVSSNRLLAGPSISPDGKMIAFAAGRSIADTRVWVRDLSWLEARPIPETEHASTPVWSPDGRYIAYIANQQLLRIPAGGGPPQVIATRAGSRGITWNRDGMIVVNGGGLLPLLAVPATGGKPRVVAPVIDGTTPEWPSFLPDGQHFLFYVAGPRPSSGLYVGDLNASPPRRLLAPEATDSGAVYSTTGHLLYALRGNLLAHPFDPVTLTFSGDPQVVADHVDSRDGFVSFAISPTGVLVYAQGSGSASTSQLVTLDRAGKVLATSPPQDEMVGVQLSPDGSRAAVHRHAGQGGDVWLMDVHGGNAGRLTFDPAHEHFTPVWSPDGRQIAYAGNTDDRWGIFIKAADAAGPERRVIDTERDVYLSSWSPDGRWIIYTRPASPGGAAVLAVEVTNRQVRTLVQAGAASRSGVVSPDAKWLAYDANPSGQPQIYVQPFPDGGTRWQISGEYGRYPRWRRDGRELFFVTTTAQMAVDVTPGPGGLAFGVPKALFAPLIVDVGHLGSGAIVQYDVSPDGQKFVVQRAATADGVPTGSPVAVVSDWRAALTRHEDGP